MQVEMLVLCALCFIFCFSTFVMIAVLCYKAVWKPLHVNFMTNDSNGSGYVSEEAVNKEYIKQWGGSITITRERQNESDLIVHAK